MVPPQFTPCGASRDPDRSAGCIGPYPSSFTGKAFNEAAPKGIPYPDLHCLAPTGSSLAKSCGYVLVFFNALSISVRHQFTTDGRASQYKYTKIFAFFVVSSNNRPGRKAFHAAPRFMGNICEPRSMREHKFSGSAVEAQIQHGCQGEKVSNGKHQVQRQNIAQHTINHRGQRRAAD